jgi:hypothetical protein
VKADRTYQVSVSKDFKTKDENGKTVSNSLGDIIKTESGKLAGSFGVTLTPDNPSGQDLSPDKDVRIVINPTAPEREQVKTTAHEAFGHAYFYELQKQGQNVNPYHDIQFEAKVDADGGVSMTGKEANTELKNQIKTVENLAGKNYDDRNK